MSYCFLLALGCRTICLAFFKALSSTISDHEQHPNNNTAQGYILNLGLRMRVVQVLLVFWCDIETASQRGNWSLVRIHMLERI